MSQKNHSLSKRVGLFCILGLFSFPLSSQAQTVTIDPNAAKQVVTFGGDCKLTVKGWSDNKNANLVAQKLFKEMKLDILRIPIYAMRTDTDPFYDKLINVMNLTKGQNSNVKFFASVANGDGDKNNNLHGASKFPSSMKGCCPKNLYSLNLTSYSGLIDDYITLLSESGYSISYLGPWNEDAAKATDYSKIWKQLKNLGTAKRIGVESWGLQTAVNSTDALKSNLDIIGAHTYDDALNQESLWKSLLTKAGTKEVWYTEATKYSTSDNINNLIAGMENIYPAIRAGVNKILFYQVTPRFVNYNGTVQPIKYSGFKNLVNNARGKKVIQSSSTDKNINVVAFALNNTLSVHIINKDTATKTVKIQLQNGYKAQGTITQTIWTSKLTEVSSTVKLSSNATWNATIPGNSYVHLNVPLNNKAKINALGDSADISDLSLMDDQFDKISNTQFELFPNPVTDGRLQISIPYQDTKSTVSVQIIRIDGSTLMLREFPYNTKLDINVPDCPTGLYSIVVSVNGMHYNQKLFIQK